jgi:hypothetical protein
VNKNSREMGRGTTRLIILLIVFALNSNLIVFATPQLLNRSYKHINFINGLDENINLLIHRKSLEIDITRTTRIRFALELQGYYKLVGRKPIFAIKVYDHSYGERELISYGRIRVNSPRTRYKFFNLDLLSFKNSNRKIEIELLDDNDNILNTYFEEIVTKDLVVSETNSISKIEDSDCDNDRFGECQLNYIMNHIHFESRIRKDLSTEIVKKDDGSFVVNIPNIRSNRTVKAVRPGNTRVIQPTTVRNLNNPIKIIEDDYEISLQDSILVLDSSKKNIRIKLPDPEISPGLKVSLKKKNQDNNNIVIEANGFLIDGKTSYTLTNAYESISIISTGSEWLIL